MDLGKPTLKDIYQMLDENGIPQGHTCYQLNPFARDFKSRYIVCKHWHCENSEDPYQHRKYRCGFMNLEDVYQGETLLWDQIKECGQNTYDPELELMDAHPWMFTDGAYLECHTGWFGIITELAEALEPLVAGMDIKVLQIKEKFGALRFYLSHQTPEMTALIAEAERKSTKTCEFCGAPGEIQNSGTYWLKCTCPVCDSRRRIS